MRKVLIFILILCLPVLGKGDRRDDPSYQVEHDRTKGYTPTEHFTVQEMAQLMGLSAGYIPYITSDYLFANSPITVSGQNISTLGDLTINSDLGDVTSKLIFGRTTGGNGEISYQGTQISTNKIFNPNGNSYGDPGTYPNKIVLWQDSKNNYFGFGISTGDLDYFSQNNHRWYVAYNGSPGFEAMALNVSGQLLINTTTAIGSEKLRVNGNEYLDGELQIASTGKVISGSKALTDGTAIGIFEVAIAAGEIIGGQVIATVKCTDDTDYQAYGVLRLFTAINKAGTIKSNIADTSGSTIKSTGSLNVATSITKGTGKIIFNVNANTDLVPTSLLVEYVVILNGNEVVTKL